MGVSTVPFQELENNVKNIPRHIMQPTCRSSGSCIPKKPSKHCKIIAISSTIIVLMMIAVVIVAVLIVIGTNSQSSSITTVYYRGSFKIVNLNYMDNYSHSNSPVYQALAAKIEAIIETVFNNSELRSQFKKSQVFRLSPGSVIPEFVMSFYFSNSEKNILKIFSENIKNASGTLFNVNASSLEISEISYDVAQNLVYGECGIGGPLLSKIMGGTNAALGSWPWQASLRLNGNHQCGASLINNTWLVTAAHCVFNKSTDLESWTAVLGTINISDGFGLSFKSIIVHENYSKILNQNDIALIELSAPVTFTQYIRPICLPDTSTVVPDNSSCYVTGWGVTQEGNLSPILQQAELKTISTSECSDPQVYWAQIKPSMLCAGYLAGKIDSCQGDSGGPLVALQPNSTWSLIGIVSFGDGCALPNKPGVYARVTYLRQWITQKTGL